MEPDGSNTNGPAVMALLGMAVAAVSALDLAVAGAAVLAHRLGRGWLVLPAVALCGALVTVCGIATVGG
jgi:hypothetical protein